MKKEKREGEQKKKNEEKVKVRNEERRKKGRNRKEKTVAYKESCEANQKKWNSLYRLDKEKKDISQGKRTMS